MRIADREIGPGAPVYIIAELGVNHDGRVERAVELTDAAAEAGADAVKLQLFRTDLLLSRAARLAAYQRAAGESDPIAMLRRLELPADGMARVVDRAHHHGLHAIVTVFSTDLVAEAEALRFDAYKTASPDIVHRPLLDALGATGRPLIVSTGASTLDEVARALGWLRDVRRRLALLQCVSAYPTPEERAELGGIPALREIFDGPVGYSDHTRAPDLARAAVLAGACLLEKHLTLDRAAPGPDHAASLEPLEFREYHDLAVAAHGAGPGSSVPPARKQVLDIEADVRRLSRQSLTTRRDLPAGHRLTRDDLTIKRPGTGLEPWRLDEIIGRQTSRALEADVPLAEGDVE